MSELEKAPPAASFISEDEEKGYERKQLKLGGFKLFAMAFSTLGIIYSDIGGFRLVKRVDLSIDSHS